MDVRDFRIMIQKYDPWLFSWIKRRTGQFKLQKDTDEAFEAIVAAKVESIRETPWKDLPLNQDASQATTRAIGESWDGFLITHRFYTIVWRKNFEEKIRYTGTQETANFSVSKLLMCIFSECEAGNTPWVSEVVETVYTINTLPLHRAKHTFVVYPCDEKLFMEWVDQNREEINHFLAEKHLRLDGYAIAAL